MKTIRQRINELQRQHIPSFWDRAAYVMAQLALVLALFGFACVVVKGLMLKM